MIPYLTAIKEAAGVRSCYVGYACCLVGFVYSGNLDAELPLCWCCGKGPGAKLIPLHTGMDHPVYSMVKVQRSGWID